MKNPVGQKENNDQHAYSRGGGSQMDESEYANVDAFSAAALKLTSRGSIKHGLHFTEPFQV